jgi:hypothetical protein
MVEMESNRFELPLLDLKGALPANNGGGVIFRKGLKKSGLAIEVGVCGPLIYRFEINGKRLDPLVTSEKTIESKPRI